MIGNGTICVEKPSCEQLTCFNGCVDDVVSGALCKPCPPGFVGDGVDCLDTRIHCEDMECGKKEICKETPAGGICELCPTGTVSNGLNCTVEEIDYTTCNSQDLITEI